MYHKTHTHTCTHTYTQMFMHLYQYLSSHLLKPLSIHPVQFFPQHIHMRAWVHIRTHTHTPEGTQHTTQFAYFIIWYIFQSFRVSNVFKYVRVWGCSKTSFSDHLYGLTPSLYRPAFYKTEIKSTVSFLYLGKFCK